MTEKEKEYQEDLKELRAYQRWFSRQIQSREWDFIADRVDDLHMNIITRLMNAKKTK